MVFELTPLAEVLGEFPARPGRRAKVLEIFEAYLGAQVQVLFPVLRAGRLGLSLALAFSTAIVCR